MELRKRRAPTDVNFTARERKHQRVRQNSLLSDVRSSRAHVATDPNSNISATSNEPIKATPRADIGQMESKVDGTTPSRCAVTLHRTNSDPRVSSGSSLTVPGSSSTGKSMSAEKRLQRRRSSRIALQVAAEEFSAEYNSVHIRPPKFQAARGLYTSLMTEARIRSVDPLKCISIADLRIREICKWAVQDIKRSLSGIGDTESLVRGFVSTGKYSIVTAVPERYIFLVVNHFESLGKSKQEAEILARSCSWYHVVDGGHLHRSLVEKIEDEPNVFGGFRWPVVEISWQPADILRSLARMCQEMQKEVHMIEFTLPEVMLNLRKVIDETFLAQGIVHKTNKSLPHGTVKKIIDAYTGGADAASSTLRSICSVTLKISTNCVREMAKLLTEECADYLRVLGPSRPFGSDTRVFKKLLSTQSLRGAKIFLDQKKTTDEIRINVTHRLRYLAKVRQSFKGFSSKEIDLQTECAIEAKRAELQFQGVLGVEQWPEEMQHLRTNLLRTTILDKDVEALTGKDEEVLPVLQNAYIAATGAHGRQLISQYHRSRLRKNNPGARSDDFADKENVDSHSSHPELSDEDEQSKRNMEKPKPADGEMKEHNSASEMAPSGENSQVEVLPCENQSTSRACEPNSSSGEDKNEVQANGASSIEATDTVDIESSKEKSDGEKDEEYKRAENLLKETGVEVHCKDYAEYERNSSKIENSFDMVICEPFQKRPGHDDSFMDEKSANNMLQFFRRVLLPGGFCFIFLDWLVLKDWASYLATNQFEVFRAPFRIIRDPSKFQKQRSNDCQDMVHDALVAKKPGPHPSKFVWNKSIPFVNIPKCQFPRYCAAIDHVPPPTQRLTYKPTRAQVRPGEWNHNLFIEILQSFCPEGGRVLDPFAGTLTSGIACVLSGRSCVLLEAEEACLRNALPRLCSYVKAKVQSRSPICPPQDNQRDVEDKSDDKN